MAGKGKFPIEVTADNKTAKGLKEVKASFEELGKPAERIGRITDRWTKGSRIGQLGDLFAGATRQASKFADAGAEASAGMLGLEGSAAVAALGVGALAVGLGVAAEKGVEFVNRWSEGAAGLGRMANMLGVSTRELQLFQRAGEYAGVDAQATASALEGLNNVINDAAHGRNDQARQAMSQLGIELKQTASGAVDTRAMLLQVADALHNETNPATRLLIANIFGVTSLLPELSKGSKAVSRDMADALKSGATISDEQAEAAQRYQRNVKQLKQEMEGLKNTIGNDVLPAFNGLLEVTNKLARATPHIFDKPIVRAYGTDLAGTVPVFGPLLQALMRRSASASGGAPASGPPASAATSQDPSDRIQAFFRGRGWSAEQARGMAAGIWAESRFDPNAVDPLSGAYGLGQWLGPRQRQMRQLYGNRPSFDQQLELLDYELKGNEVVAGNNIRGDQTADAAMRDYLQLFMRPGRGLAGDLERGDQFLGGKVHVEISLKGAPSGTTAMVSSTSPQIAPSVNIGTSLPTW